MAHEVKTDEFLAKFAGGSASGVPRIPPEAFHKLDRDVYGLVEFPIKVLLLAFREVFASGSTNWSYDDDLRLTNIYIQDQYPETGTGDAEQVEKKPAVITSRGPIGKTYTDGRQNQRRYETKGNFIKFCDRFSVPMTIHCLSKKGPEAERIASLVAAVITVDEDVFKRRGVHALLGLSIGPEMPYISAAELELVAVPVTFTMEYVWAWARRYDGTPIKAVSRIDIEDP